MSPISGGGHLPGLLSTGFRDVVVATPPPCRYGERRFARRIATPGHVSARTGGLARRTYPAALDHCRDSCGSAALAMRPMNTRFASGPMTGTSCASSQARTSWRIVQPSVSSRRTSSKDASVRRSAANRSRAAHPIILALRVALETVVESTPSAFASHGTHVPPGVPNGPEFGLEESTPIVIQQSFGHLGQGRRSFRDSHRPSWK